MMNQFSSFSQELDLTPWLASSSLSLKSFGTGPALVCMCLYSAKKHDSGYQNTNKCRNTLAKPSSAAERQSRVIYCCCPHKAVTDQPFSQHLGAAQYQPRFMLWKPRKAMKFICDKSGRRSEGFWCPSVLARSPNLQQDKSLLIWSLWGSYIISLSLWNLPPSVFSFPFVQQNKRRAKKQTQGQGWPGVEEERGGDAYHCGQRTRSPAWSPSR